MDEPGHPIAEAVLCLLLPGRRRKRHHLACTAPLVLSLSGQQDGAEVDSSRGLLKLVHRGVKDAVGWQNPGRHSVVVTLVCDVTVCTPAGALPLVPFWPTVQV